MEVFGIEHLLFLLFSVVTYFVLLFVPVLLKLNRENTRKIFAWILLFGKTIELIYQFWLSGNSEWIQDLPLQLCDIAHFLGIIMLFTGNKRTFEILYFWSIGAVIANLTPEISIQATFFRKILFFLNHTLVVLSVGIMEKYYGYRPYFKSLLKSFGILALYSIPIIPLNLIIKTNFLFLRKKPAIGSIMDYLGPWPYYIISLYFVVFAVFLGMYLGYFIRDRFR